MNLLDIPEVALWCIAGKLGGWSPLRGTCTQLREASDRVVRRVTVSLRDDADVNAFVRVLNLPNVRFARVLGSRPRVFVERVVPAPHIELDTNLPWTEEEARTLRCRLRNVALETGSPLCQDERLLDVTLSLTRYDVASVRAVLPRLRAVRIEGNPPVHSLQAPQEWKDALFNVKEVEFLTDVDGFCQLLRPFMPSVEHAAISISSTGLHRSFGSFNMAQLLRMSAVHHITFVQRGKGCAMGDYFAEFVHPDRATRLNTANIEIVADPALLMANSKFAGFSIANNEFADVIARATTVRLVIDALTHPHHMRAAIAACTPDAHIEVINCSGSSLPPEELEHNGRRYTMYDSAQSAADVLIARGVWK